MQRFLLNLTTGEISTEGTGRQYEYEIVWGEEIDFDDYFQIRGTREDGTEFTATLTVDQYFDGKEFVIDAVEETVENETAEIIAIVETVKADVVKAVEMAKAEVKALIDKAVNTKGSKKRSNIKIEAEDLIKANNQKVKDVFNEINKLLKYRDQYKLNIQDDIIHIGDKANELYDIEYLLEDLIFKLDTNAFNRSYTYMDHLVGLNID